ncbi:MAG: TetR/AcrR family transcriptional regulator [Propionibacteriaceae bacterium]|nr:TetR/AcrR family transcriptional regulator [Propionibacteriaceae bacterium]
MSEQSAGPKRAYRSTVRAERAAATRARIAAAAHELFQQHGFAGTTVAAIAARAGVTPQTVYSGFGSKGAIVSALVTGMEADAGSLQWLEKMNAEPDPGRRLEYFARWTAAFFSATAATDGFLREAATDPAVVELREEGDRRRRAGVTRLVEGIAAQGALAPGLSIIAAVDQAWMLTGLELYLAARDGCGWPAEAYAEWLGELLRSQLLG